MVQQQQFGRTHLYFLISRLDFFSISIIDITALNADDDNDDDDNDYDDDDYDDDAARRQRRREDLGGEKG